MFAEVGLTPTQFGVLAQLEDHEPRTQADLARGVLLRPQSMGELVESLLARGLIARDGPGGRGRRVGIRLTDAGRALLAAAWPQVRKFNAPATLGLSQPQADTLDDLLHRVRDTVGAPDRTGDERARGDGETEPDRCR
ncbi:DNA-binding MarR family transcriptional regulator [Pseudonocardia parietis]|uniref:DNA-binding MarR family transcriptional regulator n=1 Tax=Pseudonocardia parietis TaxID=570936 RepID=A0ABS4W6Y5_9PSEU|nr:DNA-binding MarR family transcriptional regulator [Pseudonocardia parietis]